MKSSIKRKLTNLSHKKSGKSYLKMNLMSKVLPKRNMKIGSSQQTASLMARQQSRKNKRKRKNPKKKTKNRTTKKTLIYKKTKTKKIKARNNKRKMNYFSK